MQVRADRLALSALLALAFLLAACAPAPAAPAAAPAAPAASPAAAQPAASPAAEAPALSVSEPKASGVPSTGKPLTPVTFTLNSRVPASGVANYYVGDYLGYYAEEGIKVNWTGSDGAGQSVQLLGAGRTDVVSGLQDAVFAAMARGQSLPIKSTYNYNYGIIYQLAVKPDSKIAAIEELKGKKIGVLSLGHPGMEYAKFALRSVGLNPDKDVEFVAVGQGAPAGNALYNAQVDAVSFWDFMYLQLEKASFPVKLLPHPAQVQAIKAGHTNSYRADFIEKNPQLVIGFNRAHAKGTVFSLTNPDATIRIFFRMFPEAVPKGIDFETAVKNAVDELVVRSPKVKPLDGKTYGYHDPEAWRLYVQYLGFDPAQVDPTRYYTNQLIEQTNQFDQQAIVEQARNYKLPPQ